MEVTESIIDGNMGIGVDSVCYFCKTNRNLERHHIFGGANRNKSEQYGLTVILCHNHHNEPPDGVHFNAANDKLLKSTAQSLAMIRYGWSVDDFQKIFGKSYIAHEIVDDVQLLGGCKLHRYTNTAGVPCSAIYSGGLEMFSAPRSREDALVECWNKLVEECC